MERTGVALSRYALFFSIRTGFFGSAREITASWWIVDEEKAKNLDYGFWPFSYKLGLSLGGDGRDRTADLLIENQQNMLFISVE